MKKFLKELGNFRTTIIFFIFLIITLFLIARAMMNSLDKVYREFIKNLDNLEEFLNKN